MESIFGWKNPVGVFVAAWGAAAVAGITAVAVGQTGAGALRGLIVQSLADSGDTSTACAVVEKRTEGFRVLFAEAAPEGATIDWQLIR